VGIPVILLLGTSTAPADVTPPGSPTGSCKNAALGAVDTEEYAVYTAVLAEKAIPKIVPGMVLLVLSPVAYGAEPDLTVEDLRRRFERAGAWIKTSTLTSYLSRGRVCLDLDKLTVDIAVEKINPRIGVVSIEQLKQVDKEISHYTVSRVGFDGTRKQAIVFVVHHCGPLCGEGMAYVLEKRSGRWRIVESIQEWVS
jgi:hypothetical protein